MIIRNAIHYVSEKRIIHNSYVSWSYLLRTIDVFLRLITYNQCLIRDWRWVWHVFTDITHLIRNSRYCITYSCVFIRKPILSLHKKMFANVQTLWLYLDNTHGKRIPRYIISLLHGMYIPTSFNVLISLQDSIFLAYFHVRHSKLYCSHWVYTLYSFVSELRYVCCCSNKSWRCCQSHHCHVWIDISTCLHFSRLTISIFLIQSILLHRPTHDNISIAVTAIAFIDHCYFFHYDDYISHDEYIKFDSYISNWNVSNGM